MIIVAMPAVLIRKHLFRAPASKGKPARFPKCGSSDQAHHTRSVRQSPHQSISLNGNQSMSDLLFPVAFAFDCDLIETES
jgi:hypothetical protein